MRRTLCQRSGQCQWMQLGFESTKFLIKLLLISYKWINHSFVRRTWSGETGRARMRRRHWIAPYAKRNFQLATRFFDSKVLLNLFGFHLLCFSCSCQDVTPSTLRTSTASWPGSQRQSSSPHLISSIVSCHHPRDP